MQKVVEKVCGNCRLYDAARGACSVQVMIDGESYELPVRPKDECHWESLDREVNEQLSKEMKKYNHPYFKAKYMEEIGVPIQVKQIRVFSDGKNGYIEES